jgi:hypothetical protein
VEKKTPNSSPFAVLDHFIHNELDPRKIRRLLDAKGPKTPSLILLLKNEYKPYDAYQSTDQPVPVSRRFAFFTCEAI